MVSLRAHWYSLISLVPAMGRCIGRLTPAASRVGRTAWLRGAEPLASPGKSAVGQLPDPVGQPALQKATIVGGRFGLK